MERRDPCRETQGRKLATEADAPQDNISTVALDVSVKLPEPKVTLGLSRAELVQIRTEY